MFMCASILNSGKFCCIRLHGDFSWKHRRAQERRHGAVNFRPIRTITSNPHDTYFGVAADGGLNTYVMVKGVVLPHKQIAHSEDGF